MIKGALGVVEDHSASIVEPDKSAAHSLSVVVDASLYVCQSHAEGGSSSVETEKDEGQEKNKAKSTVEEGCRLLASDLCASFPIRINVSQGGSDPSAVVSSIAMADFASTLSVTPTVQAIQLLGEFENHRQVAIAVITGFISSLEDEVPSLPPFQNHTDDIPPSSDLDTSIPEINDCKGKQDAMSSALISSTADPLDTQSCPPRTLHPRQGEECLSTFISSYGSPASNQHMIISQIKKNLLSSHQSLEHLHVSSVLPSHSVTRAIEDSILVCDRLQETTIKLRHAVLVTAGMSPS